MQTWALLVDSYRLLLSRKLFWITLVISALVVLIYASIGFDETGWYVLFGISDTFHVDSDTIRAGTVDAENFYRGIFSSLIVEYWFTFIATILALVSTASIFTDFMAEGSVDITLAKPMSRIHVFIVKYLGSLLFVLFQVGVFSVGVLICIGWRLGSWDWKVLLAVPIVVLFYSYLYAVHVCLSMITRSTLASLLLTIGFWPVLAGIQWAEKSLAVFKTMEQVQAETPAIAQRPGGRAEVPVPPNAKTKKTTPAESKEARERRIEEEKQRHLDRAADLEKWQDRIQYVLAVLPKTQDTVGLLQRWTTVKEEKPKTEEQALTPAQRRARRGEILQQKLEDEFNNRSPWYIIGTSLAFEFVVLSFACFLFVRRDF